ncbi:hypothetical protein FRC00_006076 [Tulasnella sp. 408]|nr:hypothetical protein FRC00_006076 [Tulasnella sp. 408]
MVALSFDRLETVAIFAPQEKLPDKKTDPEGWNAAWNLYFEYRYRPELPSNLDLTQKRLARLFETCENPFAKQAYLTQSRDASLQVLKFQVGMADYIGNGWESFVLGWLGLGSEDRIQHILRALVRLCDTFDYEDSRLSCPESANAFLERNSGRGFLDLFSTFFPPQPNSKTPAKREKPIILLNSEFDRAMGFDQPPPAGRDPDIWDMARNAAHLRRADFLCRMVVYTAFEATGSKIPTIRMRKVGWGRNERRKYKEDTTESLKNAVWVCTTCGVSEANLPQGTSILFCVRCRELDRRVSYCSKKCQAHDWKFGNPSHKTTCGKPVFVQPPSEAVPLRTFDQTTSSSRKDVYGVPPPDKGFIRSEALVAQIVNLLNPPDNPVDPKELAYIYDRGDGKALFIHLHRKRWTSTYFRIFRNHAFRNGDPKAVAVM